MKLFNFFNKMGKLQKKKELGRFSFLSNPKICFDIGAHKGEFTKMLTLDFPDSRIYSFEPFPDNFNYLKRRFEGIDNVFVYELAMSNQIADLEFNCNNNDETNSILESNISGYGLDSLIDTKYRISVESTTLDVFCQKNSIDRIDFLKIDAQGMSYEILEGAFYLLSAGKIECFQIEVEFVQIYRGQKLFNEILSYLNRFNYCVVDIFNINKLEDSKIGWCDVLFRRF